MDKIPIFKGYERDVKDIIGWIILEEDITPVIDMATIGFEYVEYQGKKEIINAVLQPELKRNE